MKETTKTSIFLAVAVLLVVVAVASRPRMDDMKSEEMVGKALFPKFVDPLAVKALEIVRPAAIQGVNRFTVTDQNGSWTIPSHDGYPADAKDRMPKIADALIDMNVLGVADSLEEARDAVKLHTDYGVIDPTSASASLGEGIGTRVTIKGANDEPLVDLIIGKAVETGPAGSEFPAPGEEERKPQRYVRIAGEPAVYVVALEAERFSTKFDDWIEKNLLDINTLDIREIFVDEYTVSVEERMYMNRPIVQFVPDLLGDIRLSYNGNATGAEKWTLEKLMGFRGQNYEYVEQRMKPDEELNVETLDAAILALNDLKIVDAARKPEKVASVLRNGESLEKLGSDISMINCGFGVVQMKDPKDNLKQKTMILSKNGDFRITMKDGIRYVLRFGDSASLQTGDDLGDGTKPDEANVGINRYLFIMAEFDPTTVPKPQPEPLLPVPTEGAEKPKPDASETAADAEKQQSEKYSAEDVEAVKKRNEAIEKRNKRAEDAYNNALEKGTKRAVELNARFAPWYYVISEDVYKEIHLSRLNVFQIKAPPQEEGDDHAHATDGMGHPHVHAPGILPAKKSEKTWPTLPGADPTSIVPDKFGPEKAEPPTAVKPEPAVEEKKLETPKQPEPAVEEKKPEAPKQPEPTVEEKKPDAPKQPEPTVEEKKPEAPKQPEPTVEEKKPEAPKQPEPAVEEKKPDAEKK